MSKWIHRWKNRLIRILRNPWTPIVIGICVIAFVLGVHFFHRQWIAIAPFEGTTLTTEEIQNAVKEVLGANQVSFEIKKRLHADRKEFFAKVPADLPIPMLHMDIQEGLSRIGARIIFAESEPATGRVVLRIGQTDSCYFWIHLIPMKNVRRESGSIALLIDDFGDRLDDFVQSFLKLGSDITISVLPGQKWSAQVATEAAKMGCEVILHLPMEPQKSDYKNDHYTILTNMLEEDIRKTVRRSLDEVPGAAGVNNHMGSQATAERRTITVVLEEIDSRDLYFIDSRTTPSTLAYDVAREMGLRCGKRDVFLDVDARRDAIRARLLELARKAETNGFSIGIGHCHRLTLEVLRQEIPKLKARGFRFVRLSEVVQ